MATFVSIKGKSTSDNLLCLRECISHILLDIPYDAVSNTFNIWGVIVLSASYAKRYTTRRSTSPCAQPSTPTLATPSPLWYMIAEKNPYLLVD